MPARSSTGPDIRILNLSPADLAKAEGFAQDLGIGTNDKFYYYVILWCKNNLKSNGDYFIAKKRQIFDRETQEQKTRGRVGTLHKKILAEVVLLESSGVDVNRPTDTQAATTQAISSTRRTRTRSSALLPPKITITLSTDEVEKGESYTVTWKSENAIVVSSSIGFGRRLNDTELNGTLSFTAKRVGSKTFSITVRSSTGRPASAKAKILIVAARAAAQPQTPPRPTQAPPTQPAQPQTPPAQQQTPPAQQQATPAQVQTPTATPNLAANRTRAVRTRRLTTVQILTDINNSLIRILKLIDAQNKFVEKLRLIRIRDIENEKRSKRETLLGSVKQGRTKVMEKIMTPLKSMFEKIINFFLFIFLGRAFSAFIRWASDPKNAEKVKALTRFLRDFWPLIAGAALFFLTPLGGLIINTIKFLSWASKILSSNSPNLDKVKNSKLSRICCCCCEDESMKNINNYIENQITANRSTRSSLSGGGVTRIRDISGAIDIKRRKKNNLAPPEKKEETPTTARNAPTKARNRIIPGPRLTSKGRSTANMRYSDSAKFDWFPENYGVKSGEPIDIGRATTSAMGGILAILSAIPKFSPLSSLSTGGIVTPETGAKVRGAGTDTQLTVLTPGEIVLQKGVRERMISTTGVDPLSFNSGPNANKPRKINSKLIGMSGGGIVGEPSTPIKNVGNEYNAFLKLSNSNSLVNKFLNTNRKSNNLTKNRKNKIDKYNSNQPQSISPKRNSEYRQLKNTSDIKLVNRYNTLNSSTVYNGSGVSRANSKSVKIISSNNIFNDKIITSGDLITRFISEPKSTQLMPIPREENFLKPLPLSSTGHSIIKLPPITRGESVSVESESMAVPPLSTVSPMATSTRSFLAEIYGIG